MNRLRNLFLTATLIALAAYPASAAVRFRSNIIIGNTYSPWGYRPYWGPGPYFGPAYIAPTHRHEGQLKFDAQDPDAQVYLDGAFAGTVHTVNSSWLREGDHDVELRSHGQRSHERIYVIPGKQVHIRPEALEPLAS